MLTKRRHIWAIGLGIGLLVVIFFLFGPKKSAEQRIAEDVAVVAREPWHSVYVQRVAFRGPEHAPSDAYVYGARPDGTPVVVHFVSGSPYTSSTAMRRLSEQDLGGRMVEFLLMPRSMVHKSWRENVDTSATHAGIALFAGVAAVQAVHGDDDSMSDDMHDDSGHDDDSQQDASHEEASHHGS